MNVDLKTPIKVNLWGHDAVITSISWRRKFEPWYPYDELLVWFDLKEPEAGTSGFGIHLPVKDYSKEKFLEAATVEGAQELMKIAARHREEKEKQKQEEERTRELDTLVHNIVNRLSGEV